MQLLVRGVEHPPPRPSSVIATEGHPARDPRLEALCLQALAKLDQDRPASAGEFAEELSRWLAETGASGPLLKPGSRTPTRPAGSLLVAAVAALIFCSGVAAYLLSAGPPAAQV